MTVFYVQCNNGLKWVKFPEEMGAMKTLDFENDKTSFFISNGRFDLNS